jgi:hypothetical protein
MQYLRYTTEMHDDFKPHSVAGAPQNVMDAIKADVSGHKVMLYMKVRHLPVLPVSCMLLALQLLRLRLFLGIWQCWPFLDHTLLDYAFLNSFRGLCSVARLRSLAAFSGVGNAGVMWPTSVFWFFMIGATACRATPISQCVVSVQEWWRC